MSVNWSWERAVESIPVLLEGFRITLLATVAGFLIAAVLGLLVAVVRRSAPGIVTVPLRMVTEFIRLTPLVVQLLFAYFLLPQFSALQIGIVVLGIHYATYMAEVYRAGIDAVPRAVGSRAGVVAQRAYLACSGAPQAIGSTVPALGAAISCSRTPRSCSRSPWSRWSRPPSSSVPGTSSTSSRSRSPA